MAFEPTCRFCGCTESRACPGGCSWHKPGYCSSCAEIHLSELVDSAINFSRVPGALLAGRPCRIEDDAGWVTVFDHIGMAIFQMTPESVYLAPHYDARELMPLFHGDAVAA